MISQPLWRRLVLRFLQVFIFVGSLVLLAGIALYLYPPLWAVTAVNGPKSPYCSVWQAIVDGRTQVRQSRDEDDLEKRSRVVRTDGPYALYATPMGQYWIPTQGSEILHSILAQEKRQVYGDDRQGVHRGDVVIDCGAHVGTYVRTALAAGAKTVVAVEPTPENVECLRRNLEAEIRSGSVVIVPKGIWDKEETLQLHRNRFASSANSFVSQPGQAEDTVAIPVTSIDRLAAELRLPRVDFIKADVKGATERMIRGGASTLASYRPRMAISTEESTEDPKAIQELVRGIVPGYRFVCGPCFLLRGNEIRNDVVFFE